LLPWKNPSDAHVQDFDSQSNHTKDLQTVLSDFMASFLVSVDGCKGIFVNSHSPPNQPRDPWCKVEPNVNAARSLGAFCVRPEGRKRIA